MLPTQREKKATKRRAWLVAAALAQAAASFAGQPVCVSPPVFEFQHLGSCVGLVYDRSLERTASRAIALWRGCDGYGSGFPDLEPAGHCPRSVVVRSASTCGQRRCGSFAGREIVLYPCAMAGDGETSCGDPALVLAHELGHVLGLGDAPAAPACMHAIMAGAGAWLLRGVQKEECELADARWITAGEGAPGGLTSISPGFPPISLEIEKPRGN